MRIPSPHRDNPGRDDLAMTPMIDVVFLLLIFFVCASVGQIRESVLPTNLAAGSIESPNLEEQPRPFGEVWLYLRREQGTTAVQVNEGGRTTTDLQEVRRRLRELAEATTEIPVILDIEAKVPLQDVIAVYDACRAARFQSINFAADAEKVAGPAEEQSGG